METLPVREQRIIAIHQKGVIKLLAELLLQRAQAGEINDKTAVIQLPCCEMHRERAVVSVHKTAMTGMTPLPMATGITLEVLAAGVTCWRINHVGRWEDAAVRSDLRLCAPRPDAAPESRLHRSTPF